MAKNSLTMILETNKLIGPKYNDWLRNLKIVLDSKKRTYVLDGTPLDTAPDDNEDKCDTTKWIEDDLQAQCLMLASMSNELQKRHEHVVEIYTHLQVVYVQTWYEHYVASKELFQ
ncbi:hypothetical protein CDL12_02665 [Handroanthus impetiginosus]|uniref:Retrotransposon Copia-like N-terminal domain-containing protein n=1 Tax=Handroanthus impetiginosus TaxID=429701 RepID=A0A2G9I4B7_9LAMI|nr:hypothetical protein CDL12_02665 [Handroanthus impetiginosus]